METISNRVLSLRRLEQVALLVLLVFLLSWDLWAILLDQRITAKTDGFLHHLLSILMDIEADRGLFRLIRWNEKGPLPTILALPLAYLVGEAVLAARLLSVLAHGALVVQTYLLGRRLLPRGGAGIWAAMICGMSPMVFGWGRLEYRECVLAAVVMGVLQLMLWVNLERAWKALLLGVVLGLGVVTKLSFIAFMVGPALWFLALRLRSRRAAAGLAAMTVGLAATVIPWLVLNGRNVLINFLGSTTSSHETVLDKVRIYTMLPGTVPLLLAGALGALLLARCRQTDRGLLGQQVLFVLVSSAQFLLLFDSWSRYILPIYPAAAVLAGGGVAWILDRLGHWPRRVVGGALAALLLVAFVWLNLHGERYNREYYCGILTPDVRPYQAYPRVAKEILRRGSQTLLMFDSNDAMEQTDALVNAHDAWWLRGLRVHYSGLVEADEMLARGRAVLVLMVRRFPGMGVGPHLVYLWFHSKWHPDSLVRRMRAPLAWLGRQKRLRLVMSARDPDLTTYELYRVLPASSL